MPDATHAANRAGWPLCGAHPREPVKGEVSEFVSCLECRVILADRIPESSLGFDNDNLDECRRYTWR